MSLLLVATLLTADFRTELLAANSATAVLQRHCPGETIRAVRSKRGAKPAPPDIRVALSPAMTETLRHRRVKLKCGTVTYSIADNWYVPQRLTPEMNRLLETSDTPYGRVIAPMKATRRTLGVADTPRLTVRAVLVSDAGVTLAGVVERYRTITSYHQDMVLVLKENLIISLSHE